MRFIVETDGERLLALMRAAAEYRRDITHNLRALFGGCVDFACGNEDFFRLILRLFASAPEVPGFETGANLCAAVIELYGALFRAVKLKKRLG